MNEKRLNLACILGLAALPLFLLAIYNHWIFDEAYKDAWIYIGYARNYANHSYVKAFDGFYYGTRLPFFLPGLFFYTLLPAVPATYAFHLFVYYAGIFSIYVALRAAVSPRAGFVGALLLGAYSYYLYAVGWTYVDGLFLNYLAVTIMFAVLAGRSRTHFALLMVATGAAYSACVNTHTSGVAWFAMPIFGYFAGEAQPTIQRAVRGVLWSACGFIGLTLAFCVINYAAGGRFLFFEPAVRTAFSLTSTANPWKYSMDMWIHGKYLIVPAVSAVASIVAVVLHLAGVMKWSRGAIVLIGSMVCTTAIMITFELLGQPWLDYENHFSIALPMVFLALGAVFAPHLESLSRRRYTALASGMYVVAIVAYAMPFHASRLFNAVSLTVAAYGALAGLAGLIVAALLLGLRKTRAWGLTIAVVCICILSVLCPYLYANPLDANNPFRGRDPIFFAAASKAVDLVQPRVVPGRDTFWFNQRSVHGDVYVAIMCIYLCAPSTFSNAFPSVDDTRIATNIVLTKQDLITHLKLLQQTKGQLVILSEKQDALEEAEASLKTLGVRLQSVEQVPFDASGVSFTIIFAKPVSL